jgi:hypothetical protein
MGERLLCTQEVIGSNPFTSTREEVARGQGSVAREEAENTPPSADDGRWTTGDREVV